MGFHAHLYIKGWLCPAAVDVVSKLACGAQSVLARRSFENGLSLFGGVQIEN